VDVSLKSLKLLLPIALLVASYQQSTSIIQPDESTGVDTVVGTANASANYGTWYGCNAGEQDGAVDAGRCLIRFELPQNVTITSATITLTQWSEASANDSTVNVHRVTDAWGEMTATWNNQPAVDMMPVGSRAFSASEANGEKLFALDPVVVQQMADGVLPNYGFEFRASVELNNLYRFYSSSGATPSQRPKLIIEYGGAIPTPTPTQPPTPTPLVSNFVIPEQHQGNLHIFVFFGQSNASGRGTGAGCATSNEFIYGFGNDYRWSLLCEPSDIAINQVDAVSIDSAGYSAALSFARSIRETHPDWSIGILNCAKGATSLSQWQRTLADDLLYGQCRKRAFAASAQGVISGFVFLQGESDAQSLADAMQWAGRFEGLVNSLHQDFGNVPVVFVQLGKHADDATFPYWSLVKAQQASVDLPCVQMVATDDLSLNGVHFFTTGYDVIGERLADALICQPGQ
jgi:hypothetical protein